MDINRMRLGLVYIFKESKSIGSQSKLQLVNFIESADEHQLKMLALDGQITGKNMLDESAKAILDERFVAATHIEESLKKASISAMNEIVKKKVVKEDEVLTGAWVGALAGLFTPIPLGLFGGAFAGATAGYLLKWRKEQMRKVRQKCKAATKGDKEKYNKCVSDGAKIATVKVKMARAKAAKTKKK